MTVMMTSHFPVHYIPWHVVYTAKALQSAHASLPTILRLYPYSLWYVYVYSRTVVYYVQKLTLLCVHESQSNYYFNVIILMSHTKELIYILQQKTLSC